jgi:hypothetical protein
MLLNLSASRYPTLWQLAICALYVWTIEGRCSNVRSAMASFLPYTRPKLLQCSSTISLIKQCSSYHLRYRWILCILLYKLRVKRGLALALRVEDQCNDESRLVSWAIISKRSKSTNPYRPKTSPKIRIRTIPTKILDCCMYDLTPISPTIPIE